MSALRPALARKKEETERIEQAISGRKTIIVIDAERVRTSLLNEMRDEFLGRITFRYVKPSILRRALESKGDPSLKELADRYVRGSIILALSDEDPFKIIREFRNRAVQLQAKSGDVATEDIVVEPGNTGLPPGPVISELNEAGIPTRIETGSVWVTKRATVAKAGDVISTRLAAALSKLGLKPIRSYLRPKGAWHDGSVLEGALLETSLEEIIEQLRSSKSAAISLAVAAKIFVKDSISFLLTKAAAEARGLASATSFMTPDSMASLVARAKLEADALQSKLQAK